MTDSSCPKFPVQILLSETDIELKNLSCATSRLPASKHDFHIEAVPQKRISSDVLHSVPAINLFALVLSPSKRRRPEQSTLKLTVRNVNVDTGVLVSNCNIREELLGDLQRKRVVHRKEEGDVDENCGVSYNHQKLRPLHHVVESSIIGPAPRSVRGRERAAGGKSDWRFLVRTGRASLCFALRVCYLHYFFHTCTCSVFW
jgi:hypothetical protein